MKRFAPISVSAVAALAFACGTAHAVISFGGNTTLATPQRPAGVVIADFNNDGNRDVAVATDTQDKITVFLGNGAGGFNGPINTQIGGSGIGLDTMVAVNFDGDANIDLVVVLQNQNLVRVYHGTGSGTFTPGAAQASIGSDARGLIAADFNNDGQLDYATANRDTNNVTIIMRAGAGLTSSSLPSGAEPRSVAAADVNADGILDLAVSCHDDRTMRTYLGSGSGTFAPAQVLSVGGNNRSDGVMFADLNNDNRPDIATTISDTPNAVLIFLNQGGSFGGFQAFNTGGLNPSHIVVADFDRDGNIDVAVGNEDSGNISVLAGNGTGGLGAPLVMASGANPDILAIGDLDNDTMIDIAVSNRDSNTTSVFINQGTPPGGACDPDLNSDGNVDQDDVICIINTVAGNPGCTSQDPDFNRDGNVDQDDVISIINVVAGGACP